MRYTQACGFLILFCACDSSPGGGSNQAFDRGITSVPQQTDLNFVDAGSAPDSSLTDAADAANGQDVCAAGGIFCVDEVTSAVCSDDGQRIQSTTPCAPMERCVEQFGVCRPIICEPMSSRCRDQHTAEYCVRDGSAWSPQPCGETRRCIDGQCLELDCLPQAFFMLDGSSSMVGDWPRVEASVRAVVENHPQVAFGLLTFPVSLGCSTATGWPNVPMVANASARMNDWLNTNGPAGGATPLIASMEWVADNIDIVFPSPNSRSLIVMTEGLDRCSCDPDDDRRGARGSYEDCLIDELGEVTDRLVAQAVDVYVIGYRFSESQEVLNTIAARGNTRFEQYIPAGSEESLTNAFQSIVMDLKACQ